MDLGWFYSSTDVYIDDYYDACVGLFYMNLTYVSGGRDVQIKPFQITTIETVEDLENFTKTFPLHVAEVRKWMSWLQKYMHDISEVDYDGYKDMAREDWEDDEDLQDKYPDFDKYFEHYTSTQGFYDIVSKDQAESWRYLHDESEQEPAFNLLSKSIGGTYEYFDSRGAVNGWKMDRCIDNAEEEVMDKLKEIQDSLYNFEDWDDEERHEWIDKVFEQDGVF